MKAFSNGRIPLEISDRDSATGEQGYPQVYLQIIDKLNSARNTYRCKFTSDHDKPSFARVVASIGGDQVIVPGMEPYSIDVMTVMFHITDRQNISAFASLTQPG